jgi:hypothetical protein
MLINAFVKSSPVVSMARLDRMAAGLISPRSTMHPLAASRHTTRCGGRRHLPRFSISRSAKCIGEVFHEWVPATGVFNLHRRANGVHGWKIRRMKQNQADE